MSVHRWPAAAAVAAAGLVVALTGCGEPPSNEGLVARAGVHVLTVEQAAEMMAPVPAVPARGDVTRSLADLWVDLTLLADAVARDSTLSGVDLLPVARLRVEQELAYAVEDTLIPRDTVVSEDELKRRYAVEAPEVRLTVAHILFRAPLGASQEERDSVWARAKEVARLVRSGQDFGALAQRYSQDPGTAQAGGALGTFGRGVLTPALEDAAMILPVGEVSEPVESPFGVHLLRVSAREAVGYEEGRAAFRAQVVGRMRARADSVFWAGLLDQAHPEMEEGAVERARELAADPAGKLGWLGKGQRLVSCADGALTAEEVRLAFQARPQGFRDALQSADSARVAEVLMDLTRRDLLLAWAGKRGVRVDGGETRRLAEDARGQVLATATRMQLRVPAGVSRAARGRAVDDVVNRALNRVLTGELDPVPLGQVAMRLRERAGGQVFPDGVTAAAARVEAIRAR